jgi:hypothetical protein
VSEVTRVAGGAGTRELWTRGGPLRPPGPGELARRLDALRAGLPRAAPGPPAPPPTWGAAPPEPVAAQPEPGAAPP